MALKYYPKPGEILLCNFNTGFIEPEMVKLRPIVVISPRLRNRYDLVSIVPLSTTKPDSIELHHYELILEKPLPKPFHEAVMWAKCDMLATVSLKRLDRFKAGRGGESGARYFVSGQVTDDQLKNIRIAILNGLGFQGLTVHI